MVPTLNYDRLGSYKRTFSYGVVIFVAAYTALDLFRESVH